MDETDRVPCNRCGSATLHRLLNEEKVWGWREQRPDDVPDHPDEADWSEHYQLFQCCGCEGITLRHRIYDSLAFEPSEPDVHYYPPRLFRSRPAWFADLPADLTAILDEVYSALANDSRRLAAMGARAVIDMVLTEKATNQGSFPARLDALEVKGLIGRANREHLAAVLEVGHAAAHRGHIPSIEDLARVIDILENVLQSAYTLHDAATTLSRNTPRRYPRGV